MFQRKEGILILLCAVSVSVTGCLRGDGREPMTTAAVTEIEEPGQVQTLEISTQAGDDIYTDTTPSSVETVPQEGTVPSEILNMDLDTYFGGLNGAAYLYSPKENQVRVYNRELAETRRSPCSTFKIISSLIGLETGVIQEGDAIRAWSGETFWNEKWNRDIGFEDAFRTSCIWYFREVIDELGEATLREELERLSYGNCDVSDWKGHMNTNNSIDALRGFWVESSLKISPKEQTEVMERIFGRDSIYKQDTLNRLRQVMLVTDQGELKNPVYGKTGLGKVNGETVDAWFTGFTDTENGPVYFCVYLGMTGGADVSSTKAKEIAIKLISDLYG